MSNFTGNIMKLSHFQDFYILQALQAGMGMAKSANGDNQFRHSFVRLENDIADAMTELSHEMAKRIRSYLWYAALGEAYYAKSQCKMYIPEIMDDYKFNSFEPNHDNTEIVAEIYDQRGWNSAYGGQAWLQIVRGLQMYGKIPDVAFVDHAADLEHNGGCVFNKGGTSRHGIEMSEGFGTSDMRHYLDYKFRYDILNEPPEYSKNKWVTFKTLSLVKRYDSVVEKIHAANFLYVANEWLTEYSMSYGKHALSISENNRNEYSSGKRRYSTYCDNCECGIHSDHEHINSMCLCNRCYRELMENMTECENCGDLVENYKTVYVEDEYTEVWCISCYKNNTSKCEKCERVYSNGYLKTTEDNENLCRECARKQTCKTCHEVYFDMETHLEEHNTPLCVDADGFFEDFQPFEWINSAWKIYYAHNVGTLEFDIVAHSFAQKQEYEKLIIENNYHIVKVEAYNV